MGLKDEEMSRLSMAMVSDKLSLMEQFRRAGLSQRQVAERLGVRQQTISKWERKIGKPKKTNKPTKEILEQLYWQKGLSLQELGGMFGVSSTTIQNWMVKYGISRRKQLWTYEEFEILKEMYQSYPKEEVLKKIKRTWRAIVKKAGDLGIYRGALLPPLEHLPNLILDRDAKVWIACAIDCEGSLGLGLTKTGFYHPYISINNTKRVLLNHFRKLVGCTHKTIRLNNKRYQNRKNIYQFDMGSTPWIYALLREIRPYIVIKGKQADLLLEFIEIIDGIKQNNNGRIAYTERVHEIYHQLKKLNKRGKK